MSYDAFTTTIANATDCKDRRSGPAKTAINTISTTMTNQGITVSTSHFARPSPFAAWAACHPKQPHCKGAN